MLQKLATYWQNYEKTNERAEKSGIIQFIDEIFTKKGYDIYIFGRYLMKIIVVGGGKVGTALCRSLVAEKHDVVLIEQNEAVLNHITKRYWYCRKWR